MAVTTITTIESQGAADFTAALNKIPVLRYLKDPATVLSELYARYPAGGEYGWFAFVTAADSFAYWDTDVLAWVTLTTAPRSGSGLENFTLVSPIDAVFNVDHDQTPYAELNVTSTTTALFLLNILNVSDGESGKILVIQPGYKQIELGEGITGTIDLPLAEDSAILIYYKKIGSTLYVWSDTLVSLASSPAPQKITDLVYIYFDTSLCTLRWTIPYGNNVYDTVTGYDLRYSNNSVDADISSTWNSLAKITTLPTPSTPGTEQTFTLSGLKPGLDYYFYLKSYKINYGNRFTSESSNEVHIKTLSGQNTDANSVYRISVSEYNLTPVVKDYVKDSDGNFHSKGNIVDEIENAVFLESGYPDTTTNRFSTYWETNKYTRGQTEYFSIIIDLLQRYSLDKLFIVSGFKPSFSVYTMKDIGYSWEKIAELTLFFNEWESVLFEDQIARFIKLQFDLNDIGENSTNPVMLAGEEAWPDPQYNDKLDIINNIFIYGIPAGTTPEGIKPPYRDATIKKTVDQFVCTNGHYYQQGRIHSMCSGEKVRLYGAFGQFSPFYESGDLHQYARIADVKFRLNHIPWVASNNGTGEYLQEHLINTYKKYGLKPFLCSTGNLDSCFYNSTITNNRPVDDYWYPETWRPLPKRGVGGLEDYFAVTKSALHYKSYAKLCYALAGKYGNNSVENLPIFQDENWDTPDPVDTGLDLISGLEVLNEPDKNWEGFNGYTSPEECAALVSACYDGHFGEITDEDSVSSIYGVKNTASNILTIAPGLVGIKKGYTQNMFLWSKTNRADLKLPFDVLNFHLYCSNTGLAQESNNTTTKYAITFESAIQSSDGDDLREMIEFRNTFAPDKEIWITEFGYGEAGRRNSLSQYQCYSLPGRTVGSWIIPDRHRSEVKGAWTVRACLQMMKLGIDMINYYSTECEENYFDSGQWGQGAGFEMWEWDKLSDETPGAKYAAIEQHEVTYERGGFSSTGLFGQILGNGAYPITKSFWWISTFRNRLTDYVFIGMKNYDNNSNVVIACFKKKDEEKGAYVVYYNDAVNNGVENAEIPVPESVSTVKKVSVYIPSIPDPRDVPTDLGADYERTGLPTSTHAIVDGVEIVTLPTEQENPYFPIVGPVAAKSSSLTGTTLGANMYALQYLDEYGDTKYKAEYAQELAWRQVNAICDYIEHHQEGIRGSRGDESVTEVLHEKITVNISEFPDFYFFDAVPEVSYSSAIYNLSGKVLGINIVELWWNNNNTQDTGYIVYMSEFPESGYEFLKEIGISDTNSTVIDGLLENRTYYFKVMPVSNGKSGSLSDYAAVKTFLDVNTPYDVHSGTRTSTSISISWQWMQGNVSDFDFYSFYIYRATNVNDYSLVAKITDKNQLSYVDSSLSSSTYYYYKIKVITKNGNSDYSEALYERTLMYEETVPLLLAAETNTLGTQIKLRFNIEMSPVNMTISSFVLAEAGLLKEILGVNQDTVDTKVTYLTIAEGTLSDYDVFPLVTLAYTKPAENQITSAYNVALESFNDFIITNKIGSFVKVVARLKADDGAQINYISLPNGSIINSHIAGSASYFGGSKQYKSLLGDILEWYFENDPAYYPLNSETVEGAYLISFNVTASTGDSGPYADEYITDEYMIEGTGENNTKKGRLVFSLPAGSYQMKFLMCGAYTIASGEVQYCFYRIDVNGLAGAPVQAGPVGFTGSNNVNFNATIDFTVNDDSNRGNVVLYLYNTNNLTRVPGISLLEIIKLD